MVPPVIYYAGGGEGLHNWFGEGGGGGWGGGLGVGSSTVPVLLLPIITPSPDLLGHCKQIHSSPRALYKILFENSVICA